MSTKEQPINDPHIERARAIVLYFGGDQELIQKIAAEFDKDEDLKANATAWYEKNIVALLRNLGADEGQCKGCGQDIFWLKNKSGRKAPYTVQGLNHFADCPKAADFRK